MTNGDTTVVKIVLPFTFFLTPTFDYEFEY